MDKICTKCTILKNEDSFHRFKGSADGLKSWCKACCIDYNKKYNIENKEKLSVFYKKRYYNKREDRLQKQKQYASKNKDSKSDYDKKYYELNKIKIIKNKVDYVSKRIKKDLSFKIKFRIRDRLRKALKTNQKKGSAIEDLGCTIEELKLHLESKFHPGMTWDNYGLHGWHIDHIKPLIRFNLEDIDQFKQACHYSNLQPLWAKDNLSKGAK